MEDIFDTCIKFKSMKYLGFWWWLSFFFFLAIRKTFLNPTKGRPKVIKQAFPSGIKL